MASNNENALEEAKSLIFFTATSLDYANPDQPTSSQHYPSKQSRFFNLTSLCGHPLHHAAQSRYESPAPGDTTISQSRSKSRFFQGFALLHRGLAKRHGLCAPACRSDRFKLAFGFDSVQSLSCQRPATRCCNPHIQLRYGAASSEMRVVIIFLVLQPPYGAVAAGKLKQDDAGREAAGDPEKKIGPFIRFIGKDRSIGRLTLRWHFAWFWRVRRARHASTRLLGQAGSI